MRHHLPTRPLLVGLALAGLLLAPLATPAAAQTEIQRRRAAPAKGTVSIENDFGSLTVRGWERNEVLVQGTLAAGAEGLSFEGEKGETSLSVEVPEEWFHAAGEAPAFRSTLTVSVPAGSRLQIETVNATVVVEKMVGTVEVQTVNGGVRIDSPVTAVEVDTMTGSVSVRSPAAETNVHSISGEVLIEGATGRVQVETMSGKVTVRGAGLSELEVETIAGAVELQGTFARRGKVSIETFSSPVRLLLPAAIRADFDLQTFSGQIRSQFCAGTPLTKQRFEPFRQLRCSTGGEELEITVRTHDADITVAPAGGQ
jgi:hypothetical protein